VTLPRTDRIDGLQPIEDGRAGVTIRDEEIVRRATVLGFDPVRVAIALGRRDLAGLGQADPTRAPDEATG
jgi:hypothetical protein